MLLHNQSPFLKEIMNAISAASRGEDAFKRWEKLREIKIDKQTFLLPLDNDGTFEQQFIGLRRWCLRFTKELGLEDPKGAELVALAYVARQLEAFDSLFGLSKQAEEPERLRAMARKLGAEDPRAAELFGGVADALDGRPDGKVVGNLLFLANAAFHIETGVSALNRGEDLPFKNWWEKLVGDPMIPKERSLQAFLSVFDRSVSLAAEAWEKNYRKLKDYPEIVRNITSVLNPDLLKAMMGDFPCEASAPYFQGKKGAKATGSAPALG